MKRLRSLLAIMLGVVLTFALPAQVPPAAPPAPQAAPVASATTFSQEELEQLLAPIALYPDALLAQVLMASTYPLEIVQAERWVKANPGLKDKALEDALQQQPWDPSVKSLAVFPQVLDDDEREARLDAEAGRRVPRAAKGRAGDRAGAAQQGGGTGHAQGFQGAEGCHREPRTTRRSSRSSRPNPEVVYVPTYNPTVVYGAWPYPAYPPYYYYPPGYVAGGALARASPRGSSSAGALWGNCNWGGGDVNINVNRYNNFNRTNISNGNWNHAAQHRGAVPYRDKGVAQQYGRGQAADAASRDAFRGRADAGRDSMTRGDMSGTRNASAFDTGRSTQTRDYSNRGNSSLNSARSSGNMGGGARGGGGRGGGGRGGRR